MKLPEIVHGEAVHDGQRYLYMTVVGRGIDWASYRRTYFVFGEDGAPMMELYVDTCEVVRPG